MMERDSSFTAFQRTNNVYFQNSECTTNAVDSRRIASSVLADVKVVSLLLRASLRISMYAPVI